MRTSLSRTTIMMVVAASLAAFCVTGCQTTGVSKTPSSSWFSWGKKKPASTTLGSNMTKPSSSLPAPPSSTASPNPVPSYAQNTPRAGYGAGPTGSGMANSGRAVNPSGSGYGTQGTGSGYYANASYNNNPAANPAAPAGAESSALYGRPAASPPAGSYSPSGYPDSSGQTANAGGYGGTAGGYAVAGSARPAGNSAGSYSGVGGGTGNPNSTYAASGGAAGQNAYGAATVSSDRGQVWGANSPDVGAARSPAVPAHDSRTAPADTYRQRGGQDPSGVSSSSPSGAASSYGQTPANYGSTNSGAYVPAGGAFGQDSAPQGGSYADAAGARTDSSSGLSAGGYRPGSTGRSTRFGDSQQINISSADSVQSASYNTNYRAPASDRNSPTGSEYDTGSAPSGRTATGGGSYPYPSTYQR